MSEVYKEYCGNCGKMVETETIKVSKIRTEYHCKECNRLLRIMIVEEPTA